MGRKPTFRIDVENRLRDRAIKAEEQVTELQATKLKLLEALKEIVAAGDESGIRPHTQTRLILAVKSASALIGEVEGE